MKGYLTKQDYIEAKRFQKGMWLAKGLALGAENEAKLIRELLKKFEKEFPSFEVWKKRRSFRTFAPRIEHHK